MNITKLCTAFLLAITICAAQISKADRFGANSVELVGIMPSSNTAITTRTIYVAGMKITNNHATNTLTINIRDRGTACAAAPCRLVPQDLQIAPKTDYIYWLPWQKATSGIQLSASDATSIEYHIVGAYGT